MRTDGTPEAIFSRTDVARKTREVLDTVKAKGVVVVRSYRDDQVVLVRPQDFRLLQGLAGLATRRGDDAPKEAK